MERKYERVSNLISGENLCEAFEKFLNFRDVIKIDAKRFEFLNPRMNSFHLGGGSSNLFYDREILNNTLERGTGDSSPSPPTTLSPEIDVTHSRAWLKNV